MLEFGWTENDLIASAAQRTSLRRSVRTSCQVVAEDGFRLLGEETLDVSGEGLLLRSTATARIGETVLISLRIPHGQSWIDAEGTITRVVRGLRVSDLARGFGVRFHRISGFDRALLQGALETLPPPSPARRVRPDYAATVANIMFPVLDRMSEHPGAQV
ncbi:MAG: PilZ domain-containing protein [Myxococcota bacterium]